MQTQAAPLPVDAGDIHAPDMPGLARMAALSAAAWAVVCLVQTLASYSDRLAGGQSPAFLQLLASNVPLYLPWAVFSVAFYLLLARSRARLNRPPVFLGWLLAGSLLFMVPYEFYMVLLGMRGQAVTLAGYLERVRALPAMYVFLDYVLFLGCFAFLYALAVFRRTLGEQRRRQRIEAENLALRLEAESNRIAALQAQLEPHFLFNALNALSALVRGGERSLALVAIGQLSELLRYATAATEREWATIEEETRFVEDYVGLQRLRHGDRLDFRVEGLDDAVSAIECPPLLLQPLVENALRHGLETSAQARCEIRVALAREDETVRIAVSNTRFVRGASNPGFGIGLDNLRDRLALVYGTHASMTVRDVDDRFDVVIRLPVDADG